MIPSYLPQQLFDTEFTPTQDLMLLEASAGTGKTYALERIVARLVNPPAHSFRHPLKIQEILVVTFTNRAAREMKERIRNLLLQLSRTNTTANPASHLYRQAISDFHKASIYTIHGFCKMVLSTWPVESDSPFNQELVTDNNLEYSLLRSWLIGFNSKQLDNPLAYHAIRSFGSVEKTLESMGKQLTEIQEAGAQVQPGKVDLGEFTEFLESANRPDNPLNKALWNLCAPQWGLQSMKELISTQLDKKKQNKSLEGILEIFSDMARIAGTGTSLPESKTEPAAALFAICRALAGNTHLRELFVAGINAGINSRETATPPSEGITPKTNPENPEGSSLSPKAQRLATALQTVHSFLHRWMDIPAGDNSIETWCRLAFISQAKDSIRLRIREHKDRQGLFSYNDLIQRVSEKLGASDSPLKQVLRRSFGAALIDEFQDTDENQWTIFSALFGQKNRPLMLIGDPKQSIYRFRGTNLQTYSKARSRIPQSNRYLLGTNYRSCPPLVALSNTLFAPLFRSSGYQPVKPGKKVDRTLAWEAAASPLTLLEVSKSEEGADVICREIRHILDPQTGAHWSRTGSDPGSDSGSNQTSSHKKPVNASDIVVLCRTISGEQEILQRLKDLSIPAFTVRTKSVLENQNILPPLLTLLAALEKPADHGLWHAVLLDEFFLLTPLELLEFEQEGGSKRLEKRVFYWRDLFERGHATLAVESVFAFASEINHIPWPQRVLPGPEGERKWTDLSHILELVQDRQFEDYNNRSLSAIRQWLEQPAQSVNPEDTKTPRRRENDIPAVRIITMHMAKGLEFPLVFIHAGYTRKTRNRKDFHPVFRFMNDNGPVIDCLRQQANWHRHLVEEWEEAKRLWYVAVTRASHKVWIPHVIEGAVNQFESLLFLSLSGLGDLYSADGTPEASGGGTQPSLPPHEKTAKDEIGAFREELDRRIQNLQPLQGNEGCGEEQAPLISVRKRTEDNLEGLSGSAEPAPPSQTARHTQLPPLLRPPSPPLQLAPLPEDIVSERDPITSSYSSLLRTAVRNDYDRSAAQADYSEEADRDSSPDVEPLTAVSIAAVNESFAKGLSEWPVSLTSAEVPNGTDGDGRMADSETNIDSGNKTNGNSLDIFRGTLFGNMMHKILEKCPFDAAGEDDPEIWYKDSSLNELFQSICGRYYPVSWYLVHRQALKALIRTILRSPIPNLGRLCDIPGRSRRSELEFHIFIPDEAKLSTTGIEEVKIFPGFLKGFIDLVIQHEGRWWIVDWKTNLPDGLEKKPVWDSGLIRGMMDKHHYDLQYNLYLLALCCALSRSWGRPLQWEEEIGGVMYLFVRGMNEEDSSGIFMDKPEISHMHYLTESLGLEGIIK